MANERATIVRGGRLINAGDHRAETGAGSPNQRSANPFHIETKARPAAQRARGWGRVSAQLALFLKFQRLRQFEGDIRFGRQNDILVAGQG